MLQQLDLICRFLIQGPTEELPCSTVYYCQTYHINFAIVHQRTVYRWANPSINNSGRLPQVCTAQLLRHDQVGNPQVVQEV